MSEHDTTLRDDIAFMRALAEAGREGPRGGGSILVAAGVIYAAASVASSLVISGQLPANELIFPEIWFGGTALFFVCLWLIKRRMPGAGAAGGRAAGVVWAGSGWSILAMVISLMIIGSRTNTWWIMGALGPIVLSIYGGCWIVGAAVSRERWLYGFALGSFLMAGVLAWFATDWATMFLIYAASLLFLLALPGLVLMRRARRAA
jgi:hypothetical protein